MNQETERKWRQIPSGVLREVLVLDRVVHRRAAILQMIRDGQLDPDMGMEMFGETGSKEQIVRDWEYLQSGDNVENSPTYCLLRLQVGLAKKPKA